MLGFRTHSGWAALVAVAGPPRSPALVDRRRIELVDAGVPWQPYHAPEKLDLPKAGELIRLCVRRARLLARQALRATIEDVRESGYDVVGCAILLASGRPATSLAATLASHALIHTAEGELFREALAHAGKHCRLPVVGVRERDLLARAHADLRVPAAVLRRRVTALGQLIGPPWRQDQKYAALVAWLALAAGLHGKNRASRAPLAS